MDLGTGCGDTSESDCSEPDTCDGAGVCLDNHAAVGSICTDDLDVCTADECDGKGVCTHPPSSGVCGDGTLCPLEECEDGNTDRGDGCSIECQVEAELSKDEQKCVNGVIKKGTGVAKAQAKLNDDCVKSAVKQDDAFPDVCMWVDERGKVAKAKGKTAQAWERSCGQEPAFGVADVESVSAAAVEEAIDLTTDLFGDNVNRTIVESEDDKDGAKCQMAVLKQAQKVAQAEVKIYLKCQKDGLKGKVEPQIVSGADLERCVWEIATDEKGRIAKAVSRVTKALDRGCEDLDLGAYFPGDCAKEAGFGACLADLVDCRVCRSLNRMAEITVDCDLFDNGSADLSCSF